MLKCLNLGGLGGRATGEELHVIAKKTLTGDASDIELFIQRGDIEEPVPQGGLSFLRAVYQAKHGHPPSRGEMGGLIDNVLNVIGERMSDVKRSLGQPFDTDYINPEAIFDVARYEYHHKKASIAALGVDEEISRSLTLLSVDDGFKQLSKEVADVFVAADNEIMKLDMAAMKEFIAKHGDVDVGDLPKKDVLEYARNVAYQIRRQGKEMASCGHQSVLVLDRLRRNEYIGRVRLVHLTTSDHGFVIIGSKPNEVVIDPWIGKIYSIKNMGSNLLGYYQNPEGRGFLHTLQFRGAEFENNFADDYLVDLNKDDWLPPLSEDKWMGAVPLAKDDEWNGLVEDFDDLDIDLNLDRLRLA